MDDAEHMPFYVLFGVIVAAMLAGLFIVQYNRQLEARVDEQAQALVNDLARISFAAFSREQPSFLLPQTLGGSDYELRVYENKTFVVRIKSGRQSGMSYYSTVNVSLFENNFNPVPGSSAYFKWSGNVVIISSSPIKVENILPPTTATPPDSYFEDENKFYKFAKKNPKAATAITAAYFFALENYQQVDVTGYEFDSDNDNIIFVQISSGGGNIFRVKVSGYENWDNVGKVDNSWIVTSPKIDNDNRELRPCPSIENADNYGLLYSRTEALTYLRSRTWQRENDNLLVVVPADALVQAAAATTNVSTYITWRVEWRADVYYVLHYRAMLWWARDPSPGFVFQSEPPLEAVA